VAHAAALGAGAARVGRPTAAARWGAWVAAGGAPPAAARLRTSTRDPGVHDVS
ncbi:MAG: hypothetical protein JNM77_18735, partial [Pseudonocardia sp.]|nr:hypothetical protein [Pseudonocardia sp.]